MSVFNIDNSCAFIDELKNKIGYDVILFGLDNMSYYGLLQDIDSSNIATLVPAILSASGLVEIQNPAEVSAALNTVSIELCSIISFGYDITADPFVLPDDNAEDVPPQEEVTVSAQPCINLDCKCDPDGLIDKLIESQQLIAVSTLGGFIFAGNIKSLQHRLLKLIPEYIFAPGGDGSTLFSIGKVVINLEAATAVGS